MAPNRQTIELEHENAELRRELRRHWDMNHFEDAAQTPSTAVADAVLRLPDSDACSQAQGPMVTGASRNGSKAAVGAKSAPGEARLFGCVAPPKSSQRSWSYALRRHHRQAHTEARRNRRRLRLRKRRGATRNS